VEIEPALHERAGDQPGHPDRERRPDRAQEDPRRQRVVLAVHERSLPAGRGRETGAALIAVTPRTSAPRRVSGG